METECRIKDRNLKCDKSLENWRMPNLTDVLNTYNIAVVIIHEVRWLDVGQLDVGEYVIL